MYLSRLVLNPRSRRARSESADLYQMHRTVLRAFPETLPPEERVLFRLEAAEDTGILTLLVQSSGEPDWSWLAEQHGYLLDLAEPNPWVKPFNPIFRPGQQLAFRLLANPTVRRAVERNGKLSSARHALYREEDQAAWLARKAEQGGFTVLGARIRPRGEVKGYTRERHALCLYAVQYDGRLEIIDPEQFERTLRQGIGPAKGLGFGLLSVAPPPSS